ncbi:uncharacterized protein LOC133861416 isoform X2 [Alnus glutinosa]|uniref:uncharacterized protein LOC133861416 isoform X2 n=1 Tax=Alnus glutinosa TaxID=3517 RepID=UPI002D7726DD|nr:uncharacterized protein LOC133861416 isoform X2 [Alnus glutinosa]
MLKRSVSDKLMVLKKHKKNTTDTQSVKNVKKNRFLITINVNGSAGPVRFMVNEDDVVAGVIDTILKAYARVGRLPVLGSDVNNFLLYQANAVFEAPLLCVCGGK